MLYVFSCFRIFTCRNLDVWMNHRIQNNHWNFENVRGCQSSHWESLRIFEKPSLPVVFPPDFKAPLCLYSGLWPCDIRGQIQKRTRNKEENSVQIILAVGKRCWVLLLCIVSEWWNSPRCEHLSLVVWHMVLVQPHVCWGWSLFASLCFHGSGVCHIRYSPGPEHRGTWLHGKRMKNGEVSGDSGLVGFALLGRPWFIHTSLVRLIQKNNSGLRPRTSRF